MDTLVIIVIAVVVLLILLAVGGAIATSRRARAGDATLFAAVEAVNDALAAAHAEDKGWEPGLLQEAASAAFAAKHPGAEIEDLHLVHVDDRPGTVNDRAVFRATAGGVEREVVLGRDGDAWVTVEA